MQIVICTKRFWKINSSWPRMMATIPDYFLRRFTNKHIQIFYCLFHSKQNSRFGLKPLTNMQPCRSAFIHYILTYVLAYSLPETRQINTHAVHTNQIASLRFSPQTHGKQSHHGKLQKCI